ncbi:desampylase [Halegenticoccus soli]|uniref:desampylase n=1 Tax=Halegenticoccus soli TaxID=1985678 RepID=UPI001E5C5CBF|nr:desampylase [Halegenticoccus soli]
MTSELTLADGVRGALLRHARQGLRDGPREVCGVLVGARARERDGADRATDCRRVPNVAANPRTEYELDPAEALAAIEDAEAAGLDVVGFYHSHPESPPVPSETDRDRATWNGYVYLIVAPRTDEVRAWRWTGEAFDPLPIAVE